MQDRADRAASVGVDSVAAALGAGAGALTGDPALVIAGAGLAPPLAEALGSLWHWRRERSIKNVLAVIEEAQRVTGLPPDLLAETIRTAEDRRRFLLFAAIDDAARATSRLKMRALGRLIGRALPQPGPSIDETRLLLAAVRELEDPHFHVLKRLYDEGDRRRGLFDRTLAKDFDNGIVLLYSILNTLNRHALAGPLRPATDPDEAQEWAIWDFGYLLVTECVLLDEDE